MPLNDTVREGSLVASSTRSLCCFRYSTNGGIASFFHIHLGNLRTACVRNVRHLYSVEPAADLSNSASTSRAFLILLSPSAHMNVTARISGPQALSMRFRRETRHIIC